MNLYHSTLLAVLSLPLVEAGHHRLDNRHHAKAGKAGTGAVPDDSKSGKDASGSTVHSMTYTDTDDNMSIVYTSGGYIAAVGGKSDKDSKSGKADAMMAKTEKPAVEMSMVEAEISYMNSGETEHVVGKAGKVEDIVSIAAKTEKDSYSNYEPIDTTPMSMAESVGSVVYTTYTGKADKEAKAAKSMDVDSKAFKAGKSALAKSLKPLHSSMSMAESDGTGEDEDGLWVLMTTQPAITTVSPEATEPETEVAASTEVPASSEAPASTEVPASSEAPASTEASTGSTISPDSSVTATPGAQSTTAAMDAATDVPSTPGPMKKTFNEELFEEEVTILKNGHGSDSHQHGKSGESVEFSNKIASGNHIRPDALQSSDGVSLIVSRVSVVAVCLASFYALAL